MPQPYLALCLILAASSASSLTPASLKLAEWRFSQVGGLPGPTSAFKTDALAEFPAFNFTQPLDHFQQTGHTFNQRYWVSTRHYRPGTGAPVIVLDAGEVTGAIRMPFLDTGIVDILTKATGGLGVVLEHRYYGTSVPVLNFTTDSLRWLNNEQAAADSANFMANIKFEGIHEDLTAPGTPWIYYGGSYAGARAAHMRVLFPDLVFGAIASSGVTRAEVNAWAYYDIIRRAAPKNCSAQLVKAVKEVDSFLENPKTNAKLKALFGVAGLTLDADLTVMFTLLVANWQYRNWDPAVNSDAFDKLCTALGSPSTTIVKVSQGFKVSSAVYNLATVVKETTTRCNTTADECFGTLNDAKFQATDLSQTWRLWIFQVCTQWGYFDSPPPDKKIPSIVSKFVNLEYSSKICKQAYPPGKFFAIPPTPRIEQVNDLGGFDIAYDRLAIIDGEVDPWRFACPNSEQNLKRLRKDTITRPYKLLTGAVHHWDENGLADRRAEPADIRKIHMQQVAFVKAWLKDFKK